MTTTLNGPIRIIFGNASHYHDVIRVTGTKGSANLVRYINKGWTLICFANGAVIKENGLRADQAINKAKDFVGNIISPASLIELRPAVNDSIEVLYSDD